jgi:hypothetical protein
MNDSFKYRCTRRPGGGRAKGEGFAAQADRPRGAGSGGQGVDPQQDWGGSGNHAWYANGDYTIAAYDVTVEACAGHPRVEILAVGQNYGPDSKAFVNVHGDKGVRITTGIDIPVNQMETDGVDIITEGNQTIVIERGAGPGASNIQRIQIEPDVFIIDANQGDLTIKSMKSITLQVADGMSSIELSPQGITIQGPLVQINP